MHKMYETRTTFSKSVSVNRECGQIGAGRAMAWRGVSVNREYRPIRSRRIAQTRELIRYIPVNASNASLKPRDSACAVKLYNQAIHKPSDIAHKFCPLEKNQ